MKRLLYHLLALLMGLSVAFGLAEIGVRLFRPQEVGPIRFAFDKDLGEIPVPGQQARRVFPGVFDFTYSNNSQGFRGSRAYGAKQPGKLRILVLGDSFAYGLGVNDNQTFSQVLEHSLRKSELSAEVINAGNPGKGTDYELKFFRTKGVKLQPDLTVVAFFPNDFQDNARAEYYAVQPNGELLAKKLNNFNEGIKAYLFHFPGYNWLISWSQAANLVKQAAVDYLVSRQNGRNGQNNSGDAGAKSIKQGSQPPESGLVVSYSYAGQKFSDEANAKLTAIYVSQLMAAAKQAGSGLVFCYIPISNEVRAFRRTRKISPDEKVIKGIVKGRGGMFLSLTPALAAAPDSLADLYYAEGHWTSRAHALAGEYLGHYLYNLVKTNRMAGCFPLKASKE